MEISLLSYTRLVIGITGTQWSSIVRQKRTDDPCRKLETTLNEHALNKIVRMHTLLRVLIARLDHLGGV